MNSAVAEKLDAPPSARRSETRGLGNPIGSANAATIFAAAALTLLVVGCYFSVLRHLVARWSREPDYSHGFIVPLVSIWLLWRRRGMMASTDEPVRGRWAGLALLSAGAALRGCAIYLSFFLMEPVGLIVSLAGVLATVGGWRALRWGWPAVMFLLFMIPLPGFLANRLSEPLQRVATVGSTYLLQTLGLGAVANGNVIWLSQGKIGVVEACSGLRMLVMFGAVTTAVALSINRTNLEKAILVLSSVGIAVAANVFRITLTGMAQELISPRFAHDIMHDFAGWLMMPLAVLLLGLELWLIARLFPTFAAQPATGTARIRERRQAVARN
jgi:exosortase